MSDPRCPSPIEFAAVVDYWAGDLTQAEEDRVEEHIFTCGECARDLAAAQIGRPKALRPIRGPRRDIGC